jgi:hypothetical protein
VSDRLRTAALGAAAAAVALAVLAPLVPELPPIEAHGGDGEHYAAMAEEPLEEVAPPPFAQRIAVPLLVAALPVGTKTGFMLVAVASLLLAGALVALIAREVGIPTPGRVAAAALAIGSYAGAHAVYNPYYVDPTTLAVIALALLLAQRRRWLAFAALATVGVLVKEVAATLIVVPYLLERRPGSLLDRRAALRAAALAVPVVACFVAVQILAPATPAPEGETGRLFFERDIFDRGVLTSAANPLVALFGLALLLWPIRAWRGTADLRRLHVWALLAVPILVFGHWERTLAVFLPLALASAFLVLRDARPAVLAGFTLGSFWITGVASALTIGEGASSVTGKLALVLPGAAVGLAALAFHARSAARPAPGRLEPL